MGFADKLAGLFTAQKNHSYQWSATSLFGKKKSYEHDQLNTEELIKDGYAKVTDLYSIIQKIAQTGSNMPYLLYKGTNEDKELVTDGELYNLLKKPNKNQNAHQFKEASIIYLLTTGNLFIQGNKSVGFGDVYKSLNILPTQFVNINCDYSLEGMYIDHYYLEINNFRQKLMPEDISHIKYFNPTDVGVLCEWGLSPIHAGYLSMTSAKNLDIAEASILENKGASGLLTNKGDYPLDPEEARRIQQAIDKRIAGADKFGKIVSTGASVDYIPMGMSPADLQLIESGVIKLRQLCNLYGVDSSLFNDPANKTYNNRKEATKSLYTEAVIPVMNKIIWGISEFILPEYNKRDNTQYKIELDTSMIPTLYDDEKVKAEAQFKHIEGILKVLESPIDDEQKKIVLQNTYHLTDEETDNLI
jgi:HK97 family phage portal protein